MSTLNVFHDTVGGGGVNKFENLGDVIYGCPLVRGLWFLVLCNRKQHLAKAGGEYLLDAEGCGISKCFG